MKLYLLKKASRKLKKTEGRLSSRKKSLDASFPTARKLSVYSP